MTSNDLLQNPTKRPYLACIVILLVIGAIYLVHQNKIPQSAIIKPTDIGNPGVVALKANLPFPVAKEVVKEIQIVKEPVYIYQVPAKTTEAAAEIVKKQIDNNEVKLPEHDRVLIEPKDDNKNVNVYSINLDRKWEIGAGAIYKAGTVSPVASVQYNASKHIGYEVIAGKDTAGGIVKIRF